MTEAEMVVSLPPRLVEEARQQIREGWFSDLNSLVAEALRRYLETHRDELAERFIRQDVEWGLRGRD
jgi:Arc/MetJ-type ribon-helix-helix transcriptional regulator